MMPLHGILSLDRWILRKAVQFGVFNVPESAMLARGRFRGYNDRQSGRMPIQSGKMPVEVE